MKTPTWQKAGSKNKGKSAHSPPPPAQPPIRCPECSSEKVWRDGFRYPLPRGPSNARSKPIQRYLCRNCGFRFSETTTQSLKKLDIREKQRLKLLQPSSDLRQASIRQLDFSVKKIPNDLSFLIAKDVSTHGESTVTVVGKSLNTLCSHGCNAKYCVSEREMKNLSHQRTRIEKRAAGATKLSEADIKGKIVEYTWWMKKQGYKESTIQSRSYAMRNLVKRGANILDPESVKEVIARTESWSEGRKCFVANTYSNFLSMLGLSWKKPRYKIQRKIPFIPTEQEIDHLIANAGKKTSTALRIAKESGARIGEILRLKWVDIDEERRTIKFEAEKGSNPRILPVSLDLIAMLKSLPKQNEYIFSSTHGHAKQKDYSKLIRLTRQTLARKLQNLRLLRITYHTIRHWKGTIEYHKTKDIIHVQQLLGHKNINNTMIYINIERAIFKETNDEFTVRAVDTLEEACKLLEVGFEYVCDMEDKKLFRKRK